MSDAMMLQLMMESLMGTMLACEAQLGSHCWPQNIKGAVLLTRSTAALLQQGDAGWPQTMMRPYKLHLPTVMDVSSCHSIFDLHMSADRLCSVYWTSALTTGLLLSAGSGMSRSN